MQIVDFFVWNNTKKKKDSRLNQNWKGQGDFLFLQIVVTFDFEQ